MAWFEDLTPYSYGPAPEGDVLNVGWLDRDHSFVAGEPEPGLAERLLELAIERAVNRSRGWQDCHFCSGEYPIRVAYAGGERALGDGLAAPNLIAHYVASHRYIPPRALVEAVMTDERADST